MFNSTELLGRVAPTLQKVLPHLKSAFPGFSTDEADAFEIGFWAGGMALAIAERSEALSASDIAERVNAEFARIEADGDSAT
jgi:hypothetical protein